MKLKVTLCDRDPSSGGPARRTRVLELEAEAACEEELLGELAVLLASSGSATVAAVKDLLAKARPRLELE